MKTQAEQTASGLTLFTSVYAFNRIALVKNGQFYITPNNPSFRNCKNREEKTVNFTVAEFYFHFLVQAVVRAYPQVVPAGLKAFSEVLVSGDLPSETVATSSGKSKLRLSWWREKPVRLLTLLKLKVYPRLISNFAVSFGGGSFERCKGRQAIFSWVFLTTNSDDLFAEVYLAYRKLSLSFRRIGMGVVLP